jgi:hypothetical protein
MKIQMLSSVKCMGMIGINPKLVGERHFTYKKLRYFSITFRLQMLFISPKTDEHMTLYHSYDVVDGVMVHPFNGEA